MLEYLSQANRAELWLLVVGTPLLTMLMRNWRLCFLPFEFIAGVRQYVRSRPKRRQIVTVGQKQAPPTTEWGWFRFYVGSQLGSAAGEFGGVPPYPVDLKDVLVIASLGALSLGGAALLATEWEWLPRAVSIGLGGGAWFVVVAAYIFYETEWKATSL